MKYRGVEEVLVLELFWKLGISFFGVVDGVQLSWSWLAWLVLVLVFFWSLTGVKAGGKKK